MTPSPRSWPVPTELVAGHLLTVAPCPVRWTVPNPRPDTLIVVTPVGTAARSTWSQSVILDVHVWSGKPGDSPRAAAALAEQVREWLIQAPRQVPQITEVSAGSAVSIPDPDSGAPRYLVTATVRVRPHPSSPSI